MSKSSESFDEALNNGIYNMRRKQNINFQIKKKVVLMNNQPTAYHLKPKYTRSA